MISVAHSTYFRFYVRLVTSGRQMNERYLDGEGGPGRHRQGAAARDVRPDLRLAYGAGRRAPGAEAMSKSIRHTRLPAPRMGIRGIWDIACEYRCTVIIKLLVPDPGIPSSEKSFSGGTKPYKSGAGRAYGDRTFSYLCAGIAQPRRHGLACRAAFSCPRITPGRSRGIGTESGPSSMPCAGHGQASASIRMACRTPELTSLPG